MMERACFYPYLIQQAQSKLYTHDGTILLNDAFNKLRIQSCNAFC
jgi:hypothetical protein